MFPQPLMKPAGWFQAALLVATGLPVAVFCGLGWMGYHPSHPPTPALNLLVGSLLFLGTAHVPATLSLYLQPEFPRILAGNRLRYVIVPLLLIGGTGTAFGLMDEATRFAVLVGYWVWQAVHYGRQNVGVYAFTAIAQTGKPPSRIEKLAVEMGTVGGGLGTPKIFGAALVFPTLEPVVTLSYRVGAVAVLGGILLASGVCLVRRTEFTPVKAVFLIGLSAFFVPLFLSTNPYINFFSYAIAHGLQYIVFLTVAAVPTDEGTHPPLLPRILPLVVLLTVGGVLFRSRELGVLEFLSAGGAKWIEVLTGGILGATMAHFVIDAGVWRLRQAPQREFLSRRFGFILNAVQR